MQSRTSEKFRLCMILFSVLLITIGYGVSFPLLAIRLEDMGVSSGLIGLNAAMPALGWLLLTPFLPRLHRSYSTKTLMLVFLLTSLFGLIGFVVIAEFSWWLVFRLAFGGGLGMFFRIVEYWLNTATHQANRGRVIGTYSVFFLIGIATGSLLQPNMGTGGIAVFTMVGIPIAAGAMVLSLIKFQNTSMQSNSASFDLLKSAVFIAPLAMAGVVAYGMLEDVPAYLLSVYTLQLGIGDDIAAYTLTAFAVGNLILAIPLGVLSDKIGRSAVMIGCAVVGLSGAILVPFSTSDTTLYLGLLGIWGGSLGGLYNVSLAHIGDSFSDSALIAANAAFGTIYAAAAMIGPLVNGTAMQLWKPHGLMVSCAAIFAAFLLFALNARRVSLTSEQGT